MQNSTEFLLHTPAYVAIHMQMLRTTYAEGAIFFILISIGLICADSFQKTKTKKDSSSDIFINQ